MNRIFYFLLLLMLFSTPSVAQNNTSIEAILQMPDDSNKINELNNFAFREVTDDAHLATEHSRYALELSEKLNYPKGKAKALLNLGYANFTLGQYMKALSFYEKAKSIRESIGDKQGVASALNNIGLVYKLQAKYAEALDAFVQSLKIRQQLGDKAGIAASVNNIGNVYETLNDYEHALLYYNQALTACQELGNEEGVAGAYNNIGNVYRSQRNTKEAFNYYQKALQIRSKIKNLRGMAESYNNLGEIYRYRNNLPEALRYHLNSLKIKKELGDQYGIAVSLNRVGDIHASQGNFAIAQLYQEEGLSYAMQIGANEEIKEIYLSLSNLSARKGDYRAAYNYYKDYVSIKDSIFNKEKTERLTQLEAHFNDEQKEARIKLLEKDQAIQNLALKEKEAQINKQRLFNALFVAGFAFIVTMVLILYRSNQQKQRANRILEEKNIEIQEQRDDLEAKNIEIQHQKELVEFKNKEITDSILYAQRIQQAILPSLSRIRQTLPDLFVFYNPRDIVSGDFYWFTEVQASSQIILVVADCVGHGVPGAFMTVMGNALLNEIVNENRITQPSRILQELDKKVVVALHQQQYSNEFESGSSGMDIVLININLALQEITFAGAKQPLYHWHNNELHVIPASKFSIGTMALAEKEFTQQSFVYHKGDMIYMATDGYQDQFGGKNGKKFMTKSFKEMLARIHSQPTEVQQAYIQDIFNHWKKDNQQTDDVLVMGVRL